jgi:hypothetical protein
MTKSRNIRQSRVPWTEREDEIILENIEKGYRKIAASGLLPGRPEGQIYNRSKLLRGVKNPGRGEKPVILQTAPQFCRQHSGVFWSYPQAIAGGSE